MLLHVACYALVLFVGFAARLLHTAMSTSSQRKVLRGRETEASNSEACKQDLVPHPSQEIPGMGRTESEWYKCNA